MDDDLEESTNDAGSADGASGPASVDDVMAALAHRRRRLAIRCLHRHGEPMSLVAVAKEVVGREPGTGGDGELEAAIRALHHRHLPTLDGVGIVEYDPEARVVALSTNAATVEPLLGALGE